MNEISIAVLVLLAALWAWVLGRPLLQDWSNRSQRDSVGHFNQQLRVLAEAPRRSTNGLGPGPSFGSPVTTGSSARRRRLQIFLGLVIASVASLFLALVAGGMFWWQHLLIDVLLVAYVAFAARIGAVERERGAKVHRLPVSTPVATGGRGHLRAVGDR